MDISNPKFSSVTKTDLDKYLQNPLQAANVVIFILVNGAPKYTIYPPANVEGTSWDIGFVNPMNGDFMGINSITGTMPVNRMEDHKEFMALYAYISQNVNIRSAFGFDKNGVQRLDDLILEPKEFTDVVAKVVDIYANIICRKLCICVLVSV